jgi:hypothetical protein
MILTKFITKKIKEIKKIKPKYIGRHQGKDFLILMPGPSLKIHQKEIKNFIKKNSKLISIGGNLLDNMFIPDYHMFINRKRFGSYGHTVNTKSVLLLSYLFSKRQIQEVLDKNTIDKIEFVPFNNKYPSDKGDLIIKKGIIHSKGGTLSTMAIGTAIIMGAKNIYIVGMDGYMEDELNHFYDEGDTKKYEDLKIVQENSDMILNQANKILLAKGGILKIITPTSYGNFYDNILNSSI